MFDGGILSRQAEGIPAHGLHDIFALHTLKAGDDITNGVVAHVPHVQAAAGIGEHGEAVIFLFRSILSHFKCLILLPVILSCLFHCCGRILRVHRYLFCSMLPDGKTPYGTVTRPFLAQKRMLALFRARTNTIKNRFQEGKDNERKQPPP